MVGIRSRLINRLDLSYHILGRHRYLEVVSRMSLMSHLPPARHTWITVTPPITALRTTALSGDVAYISAEAIFAPILGFPSESMSRIFLRAALLHSKGNDFPSHISRRVTSRHTLAKEKEKQKKSKNKSYL